MFFKKKRKKPRLAKDEPITSFKFLTLTISGYCLPIEYEVLCEGDRTTLSQYEIVCRHQKNERKLESTADHPTEIILQLLNRCHIATWNGFQGDNPPGVLDGTMFTLKGEINDHTLYADGSNNFPPHYAELIDGLRSLLSPQAPDT